MTTDIDKLFDLVPNTIFSVADFQDFRMENDSHEMTYDEYKVLRAIEYAETHTLATTDEMVDELVDAELAAINLKSENEDDTEEGDGAEDVPEAAVPATTVHTTVIRTKKVGTKKAKTVSIYREIMANGGTRKDGINRLVTELGLSATGASTYWQNAKSGKWS